jgi:ATP-binding cassette subfamily C protein LapB
MSNPKLAAVAAPSPADLQSGDALLACLTQAAKFHRRPSSRDNLTGGLPVPADGLSPELALRAARRVGLDAALVQCPLALLHELRLPVILLLHDRQACLLRSALAGDAFSVTLPGQDEPARMERDELQARYSGHAIALETMAMPETFDTEKAGPSTSRHWFRNILSRNRGLYVDVLFAALLINLFAMAMPLFTMNVYRSADYNDKVDKVLQVVFRDGRWLVKTESSIRL